MSCLPNQNMPLFQSPQPKWSPQLVAQTVASLVVAFVRILFWLLVAIAACAAGWIGFQMIVWLCRLASAALGLGG